MKLSVQNVIFSSKSNTSLIIPPYVLPFFMNVAIRIEILLFIFFPTLHKPTVELTP